MANKPKEFYQHALRVLLTTGLVSLKASQLGVIADALKSFTGFPPLSPAPSRIDTEYIHTTIRGLSELRNGYLLSSMVDDKVRELGRVYLDSPDIIEVYEDIERVIQTHFGLLVSHEPNGFYKAMIERMRDEYGNDGLLYVHKSTHNYHGSSSSKIDRYDDLRGMWTFGYSNCVGSNERMVEHDYAEMKDNEALMRSLFGYFRAYLNDIMYSAQHENSAYIVMHLYGHRLVFDKHFKRMYHSTDSDYYMFEAFVQGVLTDKFDVFLEHSYYVTNMSIHDVAVYTQLSADTDTVGATMIYTFTDDGAIKRHAQILDSSLHTLRNYNSPIPTLASIPDETKNWHELVHVIDTLYMPEIQRRTIINETSCPTCGVVLYFDYAVAQEEFLTTARYHVRSHEEFNNTHYCTDCAHDARLSHINITRVGNAYVTGGLEHYIDDTENYDITRYVHSYDYKPNRFTFSYTQADVDAINVCNPRLLFLGTEIELDGTMRKDEYASAIMNTITKGKPIAYGMRDGSLESGFEIGVMPATLDYHMHNMDYKNGFNTAVRMGYRSHDTKTCGIHVHINRAFLGNTKTEQNYRSALLAIVIERNWDDIVKFARRDYYTIERWANKQDITDDIWRNDTEKDLSDKMKRSYGHDKYVAINMQHSQSVELRIFRGTLNVRTYFATLQFVSNLAHYVMQADLSTVQRTTLQDIINFKHYNELATYATERGLA